MYNIHMEDIKKRQMQVLYFTCPKCNSTIEDLDVTFAENTVIKCPGCDVEILIGNLCREKF